MWAIAVALAHAHFTTVQFDLWKVLHFVNLDWVSFFVCVHVSTLLYDYWALYRNKRPIAFKQQQQPQQKRTGNCVNYCYILKYRYCSNAQYTLTHGANEISTTVKSIKWRRRRWRWKINCLSNCAWSHLRAGFKTQQNIYHLKLLCSNKWISEIEIVSFGRNVQLCGMSYVKHQMWMYLGAHSSRYSLIWQTRATDLWYPFLLSLPSCCDISREFCGLLSCISYALSVMVHVLQCIEITNWTNIFIACRLYGHIR